MPELEPATLGIPIGSTTLEEDGFEPLIIGSMRKSVTAEFDLP